MEEIEMNLYGASGHAKVIIDILDAREESLNFVIDDDPQIIRIAGRKVIHQPSEEIFQKGNNIVAIGHNRTRKEVASRIRGNFRSFLSHPSAVISRSATIGEGTVIMANAAVNPEALIGKHCIINTGAVVEHEVVLEDYVHISPNASIAGNVQIAEGAHIGIGAAVIPGIKIGKWATIGAGAVIIKNVPDFAVVVGNPGRIVRISEEVKE